jgi:hypothetical protein
MAVKMMVFQRRFRWVANTTDLKSGHPTRNRFVATQRHGIPVRLGRDCRSVQFGRGTRPDDSQPVQTMRGTKDGTGTSSGQQLSDDERRLLSMIAEGADGCTDARHASTLKPLSAKSVIGRLVSAKKKRWN